MKVQKLITGSLEENCYIIYNQDKCIVVDPGDDFDLIYNLIKDYELCAILITHYHFDHIGALYNLLNYKRVPVYDYKTINKNPNKEFDFEIIKTPGHTRDSVSFYFKEENNIFTGDFLFKETIGRTDLPTGSNADMNESLNKVKKLNRNVVIYPGHGDSTTLEHEIKYNDYIKTK